MGYSLRLPCALAVPSKIIVVRADRFRVPKTAGHFLLFLVFVESREAARG